MGAPKMGTYRPWSKSDDAAIRRGIHTEGETFKKIAHKIGATEGQVRGRARRLGLSKHAWSTPEDRARIEHELRQGKSITEVAKDTGWSRTSVSRVQKSCGVPVVSHQSRAWASRRLQGKLIPSEWAALLVVSDGPLTIAEAAQKSGLCTRALKSRLQRLRKKGLAICEGKSGPANARWFSLGWWMGQNQGMIHRAAQMVHRSYPQIEQADIASQIMVELSKCVKSFRPRGIRFSTYGLNNAVLSARTWCRCELMKGIRFPNQLRNTCSDLLKVSSVPFGKGDKDEDGYTFEPQDRDHSDCPPTDPLFWETATQHLPERHRTIILAHFRDERTYVSIGEELGICKERVRQLVEKGLTRIRDKQNLREYEPEHCGV